MKYSLIVQLCGEAADANSLLVTVAPFQQQQGQNNCGLFAVAGALHYAVRDDPAAISLNECKMRP